MTSAHGDVACYTCHAGWNVNFLGFHFYRNEALTQLDLLSGERTKGRVTTQEKVFTTWKSFYAGLDERGRVSPYLTGFSTMGTVDAEDGTRVLDQELPVTANGLSGMTMIHHQLHSTRPTARSCVECHRASETWGMGSGNFRLGRQLAFAADRRGGGPRLRPREPAPLRAAGEVRAARRHRHRGAHRPPPGARRRPLRDGGQARRARDRRERSARAAASRLPHGRVARGLALSGAISTSPTGSEV